VVQDPSGDASRFIYSAFPAMETSVLAWYLHCGAGGSRILYDLVVGRLDPNLDHATASQRQILTVLAEAERAT
jgi:hypothetical protein